MKHRTSHWIACVMMLTSAGAAADAVWTQKVTGVTQRWDVPANWRPSVVPDGVGVTVVITQDLVTAGQTIGIYAPTTTVGRLVLGDAAAVANSYGYTIRGDQTARALRFATAAPAAASIEIVPGGGTPTHFLTAVVSLGADLVWTNAGTQNVTLDRVMDLTTKDWHARGDGTGAINLNGDLAGSGRLVKDNAGTININSSVKSLTGSMAVRHGLLSMVGGSLRNASDLLIEGCQTNGLTALAGQVTIGNNSGVAVNPGQRLPSSSLTLRGGRLSLNGQAATVGTWNSVVLDDVTELRLEHGYSLIALGVGLNSGGTELHADAIRRSQGACLFLRGPNVLGISAKLRFDNAAEWLAGGGGAAGSSNMSVVPWVFGRTVNADGNNPQGLVTYEPGTGLRPLADSEYAADINTAGATDNVSVADFALAGSRTINALRHTGYWASTIGAGNELTIASGAVHLRNGTATIGRYDQASAGTLAFGAVEAVVHVTNDGHPYTSIGAAITGSGGLTKTGTGKLTLSGPNRYSGPTHVGAGILQVGGSVYSGTGGVLLDENTVSRLGSGDVHVHAGATLRVACADAIPDPATLRLHRSQRFSGRLQLDGNIHETVTHLYLGDMGMPAGTYGSSDSSAQHRDDRQFAGTGMLTVARTAGAVPVGTVIQLR